MKLKFFIRTSTKKEKPREVPIYVRLRDDVVDLWQKTNVMVSPDLWDPKREDLKERVVIPKDVRDKFSDNLNELRKYIRQSYDRDVVKRLDVHSCVSFCFEALPKGVGLFMLSLVGRVLWVGR